MAQINVHQPQYGYITVLDSSETHYQVRYDPPAGQPSQFHGFSLFCEACGKWLYEVSDNPATFNIKNLLESGHPGPFDIYADVSTPAHLTVLGYVQEGQGTVSPIEAKYDVNVGDSVDVTYEAIPAEGYEFDHWEWRYDLTPQSPSYEQRKAWRITVSSAGDHYFYGWAYFKRRTATITTSFSTVFGRGAFDDYFSTRVENNTIIVSYLNPNTGRSADVAKITRQTTTAYLGDEFSLSVEMLSDAAEMGVSFIGWRDNRSTSVATGYSYSAVVDDYDIYISVIFTAEKVVSMRLDDDGYGVLSANTWTVMTKVNGVYRVPVPHDSVGDEFLMNLAVTKGFYHGSSSAAMSYDASRGELSYRWDGIESELTIYLCTHKLICRPTGELESRPPELVCDCNRPYAPNG